MQADTTVNWTMELVRRWTTQGGKFSNRVLSARHKPTGQEIVLVLDRFNCVERTSGSGCPRELIEELVKLFPDCMECEHV